ncbi:MAG: hypothetical protein ACI9QQ_002313 [Myxococcota bacterium]|jgi:hypothetical protein
MNRSVAMWFCGIAVLLIAQTGCSGSGEPGGFVSVRGSAALPVSAATAWETLQDLSAAQHYVPRVTGVEFTTSSHRDVAASRRVALGPDDYLDETVVEWTEGEGFRLRLHKGDDGPPIPFGEAFFRYRLVSDAEGDRIETTMSYTVLWGPIGSLLNWVVIERIGTASVQDVADAFAAYVATVSDGSSN